MALHWLSCGQVQRLRESQTGMKRTMLFWSQLDSEKGAERNIRQTALITRESAVSSPWSYHQPFLFLTIRLYTTGTQVLIVSHGFSNWCCIGCGAFKDPSPRSLARRSTAMATQDGRAWPSFAKILQEELWRFPLPCVAQLQCCAMVC